MLKYNMLIENESEIRYKYYPEGTEDFGVVSFDKASKKCSIVSLPEADRHKRYALKMIKEIKEFAEAGQFKKEGLAAWY